MIQVDDDISLLDQLLSDHDQAAPEYRATARWDGYSAKFLDFLRSTGLQDFRSRRHEKGSPGFVLYSFGAVDLNPGHDIATPEEMYHAAASCFLGKGAKAITELEASRVGNPEGFEINGKFYTLSWLNFFCRYAYVSKFIEFKDQVIVEVGPGSGKQAEMLKKAHPELTIVLFDLPTQLYVCNQYLRKVFEGTDMVADYSVCRNYTSFKDIQKGKINILPNWKFPIVAGKRFDLLWNSASFQEMDEATAKHYLNLASSASAMFLMHNIKYRAKRSLPGERGVISPNVLKNHFEKDRTGARLAYTPQKWNYFDSFWMRKSVLELAERKVKSGIKRLIGRA